MASSIVEHFTNLLDPRSSLVASSDPSRKMTKPIRETVVYPKINLKDDNNPCLDSALWYEYVLSCGHIVTTALPSEPCAPNCHHVTGIKNDMNKTLRGKGAIETKNRRSVSVKNFYCDACVETEIEAKVPTTVSATQAEGQRADLREKEAKARGKAAKHRKCYIGLKVTSVPCHSDGTLSSRYEPREIRHPFDASLPQIGENMFEDLDPKPPELNMTKQSETRTMEMSLRLITAANEASTPRVEHGTMNEWTTKEMQDRQRRMSDRPQRLSDTFARPSPASTGCVSPGPSRKRKGRKTIDNQLVEDDDDDDDDEVVPPSKRRCTASVMRKSISKQRAEK